MSSRSRRRGLLFALFALVALALFGLTLFWGSASIAPSRVLEVLFSSGGSAAERAIVLDLRLPRALTAAAVGAALALSGLQMQTVFRNALADPYILGLSAGASLGVALVVLAGGGLDLFTVRTISGQLALVTAAALGAGAVVALMLLVASRVQDAVVLLVLGVIVGSVVGALVTALVFFADVRRTRAFVEWGFGSFSRVTWQELAILLPAVAVGLLASVVAIRPLDALLLGENYARSLGISVLFARCWILAAASLLAGATVAFAGPIGFLGIAVPHLARAWLGTSQHGALLPACTLLGAIFGLGCGLLSELPGSAAQFPVNAAAALVGGPIVFWVLLRLRRELAP